MRSDLGTLQIDRVIVHQVFKKTKEKEQPALSLSGLESPTDLEIRNYFRERIIKSLGTGAFDVVEDTNSNPPVPRIMRSFLERSDADLVSHSQELAQHLYQCQTRVNSGGLLCVVVCRVAGQRSLAVLKLEMEQAVRLATTQVDGQATFNLTLMKDLVLNKNTRVFKVGLFQLENGGGSLVGLASDKQQGSQPNTEVAEFFLSQFLGCRLRDAPEVLTKRFYVLTEGFINEDVKDPLLKSQYETALLAEMNSATGTISPSVFALNHLQGDDRQAFVAYLDQAGLPTQGAIPKDTQLVENRLRRVQVDFANGVSVIAPPEVLEQQVQQDVLEDGRMHLQITDSVKDIRGRR